MMSSIKANQDADDVSDTALERHLSDPAEKAEAVSEAQEQGRQQSERPTEPGATTEQQSM